MRGLWCVVAAAAFLKTTFALPPGFIDEGVARVFDVTAFNFAPKLSGTGHMLLATAKTGILWLFPNFETEANTRIPILDVSDIVCANGERGLNTVLAHPDFINNRYIYVYYTYSKFGNCGESLEDGPANRLSRYTMMDDYLLDTSSELILVETSPLKDRLHNGGDMIFGNDGLLYITMGDGGERAESASQDLGKLNGSILRLTEDGGIPPGNPFTSDSGYNSARCNENGVVPAGSPLGTVCEEIFSYGYRNPFRFAKDPNLRPLEEPGSTRILVNDVGGGKWEETSFLVAGANQGWPIMEGPCPLNSDTNCMPPGAPGFYKDPDYWYAHTKDGGAMVGGAFVPNGVWPDTYDGVYFFVDFVFGDFYYLVQDDSNYCRTCLPPTPGYRNVTFHSWPRPVQITFGPYQDTLALYYTSRRGQDNIRRIRFIGGDNDAPLANLTVSADMGPIGTTIVFDASESTDPNDDELSYFWDFGDGATDENSGAVVSHQYNAAGTYVASVRVRDTLGFASVLYQQVIIGTPPAVVMLSPAEGTEFAVGDVFTLQGSAADKNGDPLPASALTWEIRQHHNTHYHPYLDATRGNNIVAPSAPSPEDFEASTNSYLEIILTATDQDGVISVISRILQPKMVNIDFDTVPSGLHLVLDDFVVTTPATIVSWENHGLRLDVSDQNPYLFHYWSDGESRQHTFLVPAKSDVNPKFVAHFATEDQLVPTASPAPTDQPTMSSLIGPPVGTIPMLPDSTPMPVAPVAGQSMPVAPVLAPTNMPVAPIATPTDLPVANPTEAPIDDSSSVRVSFLVVHFIIAGLAVLLSSGFL